MANYLTKEQLISALKKDGKTIGNQEREGNEKAMAVINAYKLWYSCPGDGMAFVLCERAYSEWKAENQEVWNGGC